MTRRGNNCLSRHRYQHIRETDAELRSAPVVTTNEGSTGYQPARTPSGVRHHVPTGTRLFFETSSTLTQVTTPTGSFLCEIFHV